VTTVAVPSPAPTDLPATTFRRRIPRWVGVVFPVVGFGAVGVAYMATVNRSWLPWVAALGGAAALGLLAGFAARWSLRSRSSLARGAVAVGAAIVGLLIASLASGGRVGIGRLVPAQPEVRWLELGQLAVATVAAWLAVLAFHRAPAPPAPTPTTEPSPTRWSLADPSLVEETRPMRARRRAPRPPVPRAVPTPARATPFRPGAAVRDGVHRLRARLAQVFARRPAASALPRRRRIRTIRFTGRVEDRCPYCLDVIDARDRRGVTTCPVCRTRHHADCWAVTGMCQMPHLYGEGHVARTGASR